MTGLEIQKLRIENALSNPSVASGSEAVFKGRVFFNSTTNKLYYYNGTAWQATGLVAITLGGDLSGTATTDLDGNVTLNATINANSIALGTDSYKDSYFHSRCLWSFNSGWRSRRSNNTYN